MYRLIIISLFALGCNSSPTKRPSVNDTTVVAYAFDVTRNDYRLSLAAMYIYDTLLPDPKDITKNILQHDTSYRVAVFYPTTDSVTKRPLYQTNGFDSGVYRWLDLPKRFLVEDLTFKIPK